MTYQEQYQRSLNKINAAMQEMLKRKTALHGDRTRQKNGG